MVDKEDSGVEDRLAERDGRDDSAESARRFTSAARPTESLSLTLFSFVRSLPDSLGHTILATHLRSAVTSEESSATANRPIRRAPKTVGPLRVSPGCSQQPPARTGILGQGPQLYEIAEISSGRDQPYNMPPSRAQSSSRPSRNPGENNTTGQAASTSQPTSYYQLFSSTVDEADDTLPLTGDRQQQEAAAAQQQEQDLFDAKNESNSPQERYQRVSLTALWKNLDSRAFYEVANPKGPTSSSIGALTRPPSGLTLLDSSSRIRLTEDGVQSFISFHQGVADRRAPQEFLHQICHRNMTRLALANSVKFTNSLLTELKDAQQIIQARDKTIDQLREAAARAAPDTRTY